MKLIERIFHMSTRDDVYYPEQSLFQIYQGVSETAETDSRMMEALARAGLVTEKEQADILTTYWENCERLEKRGFVNGFRYGARLMKETEV